MAQLTEQKIIEIMREEWNQKVLRLEKKLNAFMKTDGSRKGVIGVDTKVRHKGSQLLYTVDEVGPHEVVLRTPEGKLFRVDEKDFEGEYELD